MYPAHFISEAISKDICAQLAREVVSLVPQVVDYTCAICRFQAFEDISPASDLGSSWLTPPPTRPLPLLAAHPTRLQPLVLHPLHDQDAEPEQAVLPAVSGRCGSTRQREYVSPFHPQPAHCTFDPSADTPLAHIDENLVRFLERWFPKETKEKQAYNEIERRKELLGDVYVADSPTPPCIVM
jgi:E3 ubiquitin-protein ligase BAH